MAYVAYVTTLKNVVKHPNADRLLIAEIFGNHTIVSTDYVEGEIGIYFPVDGQLSEEFVIANHLARKLRDGTPDTGYMDIDKRNVTAIKLRGEKSEGLFLPLACVVYTGVDLDSLNVGDTFTQLNGYPICQKYIPHRNPASTRAVSSGNRVRKKRMPIAPLFLEHADTEQLAYNMDAFKPGDEVEITLKMHGTSQRTGYLPVLKGYKRSLWDRITHKEGKPIYNWDYVTGTRRTVLEGSDGGYYGSNEFRKCHEDALRGKLWKGETVYYEVVGFTTDGTPIMADGNNKKLNDKEFVKQYGETTRFSYGCTSDGIQLLYGRDEDGTYTIEEKGPQSDMYVYRMTMTNEDGEVVEYTPDFVRYRCEQMGVKSVMPFAKFIIPQLEDVTAGEYVRRIAEQYYDGADPIGRTHVREGVVCRIINRPKFCAYKHKNWYFKALEGIVKVEAEAPDMEEAQELTAEEEA